MKKYNYSIKFKISCIMLITIISLSLILGILSCILNYNSSVDVLDQTMTEIAKITGERITSQIKEYKNILYSLSSTLSMINPSENELDKFINETKSQYGFTQIVLLDASGYSTQYQLDLSQEEYVIKSQDGEFFVSNPHINKISNKMEMVLSCPIYVDTALSGILCVIPDETFIHNIVTSVNVGNRGGAYALDQTGTILSDKEASRIGTINMIEDAKTDPSKKVQAEIEKKMIAGETSIGKLVSYKGTTELVAYAPIPESNGWSIGIYATQNEFLGGVSKSILITIVVIIVFIIIGSLISIRFATILSTPIQACANRLKLLSKGDIHTPAPTVNSKDEIKILADATAEIVSELTSMIQNQIHLLRNMSQGDFSTYPDIEYLGDFAPLKHSIVTILDSMNKTLQGIDYSAEQVATTCSQVSMGAQILSDGSAKQSETIEALAKSLSRLETIIEHNALSAQTVNKEIQTIENNITESNQQMEKMTLAMEKIAVASGKIEEIVHTIEEFATETDLLSLNASIEAARAGEAGKGFAVVAHSIQELALKSASAVKETNQLIIDTIINIQNGNTIVTNMATTINDISIKVEQSTSLIDEIAKTSLEQADSIHQISTDIDCISNIIQDNSAATTQSAASSHDMADQAQSLKNLIGQFKTK